MFLLLILCFVINFASEPKGISTRAGKRRQGEGSPASSASASATDLSSLLAPSSNVAAASPDSTSSQRATRSSGKLGMQQGVVVAGVVTPPQAGSPTTSGWGGSPATPGNVVMAPSSAEASEDVVMTQAEEKPTLPLAPARSSAAAGSSSGAAQSSAESSGGDVVMAQPAPGSYDPMQQPSIPGFNQLLRACFDATHVKEHGTPKASEFVVRAQDGPRQVELTFLVYSHVGSNGDYRCRLSWDDSILPCGRIVSTVDGNPTKKRVVPVGTLGFSSGNKLTGRNLDQIFYGGLLWAVTGISIDIYGGDKPQWELTVNHPNNLVSEEFVKQLLAHGIAEHARLLNGRRVPLRMSDHSPLREIYWLMKGIGKTYYEATWRMQYECMRLRLNESQRHSLQQVGMDVMTHPVKNYIINRVYQPIKNAWNWEQQMRHYSDMFRTEMDEWFPDGREFGEMTVGAALNEFMQQWKSKKDPNDDSRLLYNAPDQVLLAQDTFVFFFRFHKNFETLAKQVLSGYDDSCIFMVGLPKPDLKYQMTFEFRQTAITPPGAIMVPSYPLEPSRVAESMQRVWGAARAPPPRSGPGSGAGSSAGSSGSSGAPQIASPNADVHNFQGFFLVALFLTVFLANLRKWKEHHDQVYVSFEDQA